MNYQETLDYLYSQLPVFQRIGAAAYKADLTNTVALCRLAGNPENKFRSIHIAGTNGKGSTTHLIASILQEAGYKTGIYTSPHLKDFRERIKINGKMIPRDYVVSFVKQYKTDFEKIQPSFFEATVMLAFSYFADKKVDVAVIETGMGGRLDSTNVITPALSVITNISLDHTSFLGKTLPEIATEKSGIIKKNIPVVIGEATSQTKPVFISAAEEKNAPLFFTSSKPLKKNYTSELKGDYQSKNIRTVLQSIEIIRKQFPLITEKNIRDGIKKVVTNTGLRGRWEKLSEKPFIICDIGHNEAGIREVVKQIRKTKFDHLHIVMGVVNDKDVNAMLSLLHKKASYYFCKASIPRALDENKLSEIAFKHGLKGNTFPNVKKAILAARKNAGKKDMIFIGGSAFVVAEAL
jgi:dihydrofolate synthase / folylpolyglutamate synthase